MDISNIIDIIMIVIFILAILINIFLYRKFILMKKSKEKFETIIDESDSIIFTKDLFGHYTYVNKQFAKAQGDVRENIIGKHDSELYPKVFAETYYKNDQLIIKKQIPIQFSERDPKQPEVHFITNKFPLFEKEELYGIGGITTNVSDKINLEKKLLDKELSEKKNLEEQLKTLLKKKEKQFNAIIDNNPDWIIILDKDGTWIDYHDTEFNPITDYIKMSNPNGKNIKEFLPPDFYKSLTGFIKDCLNTQKIITNESTNENNQFFEEYYVPLSSNEIMAIIRNITHRKKTEIDLKKRTNELEEVNSQLIEFSYVLSHDLKAPLIVMGSLIESMMVNENNPSTDSFELIPSLKRLQLKINSMVQLINGLLRFFEITQSKEALPYEVVDCNVLLKEILETLNPENFKIEIQPNLPRLQYYKVRLYQVFQNLISNSIKYNDKPQGIIKISATKSLEDHSCTFNFYDNGIGIAPEDYNKIFNVFSLVGRKTPELDSKSSGIGLSIVKKVIETMGGKIEVNSVVNVETTFKITIPDYYVLSD